MSLQFSDQHHGKHRKMLLFKFALPDAKHMDDMVRLVALIPYYIDLVGRYRLSSQVQGQAYDHLPFIAMRDMLNKIKSVDAGTEQN